MDQGPTNSDETVDKPTKPTDTEGGNDQDSAQCTKSTNLEPVSPLLSPSTSGKNTFPRRKSGPKTHPKPTKYRTNSGDYGQPTETLLTTTNDKVDGKTVDNAATELSSLLLDAEDIKSTAADSASALQIPTTAEGNTPLRRRSGPKTHPKPKGYRKSEYHGQTPEVDNTTAGAASELSPPLKENVHVRQRDQDLSASFDELSLIDDSGKSSEKSEGRPRSRSLDCLDPVDGTELQPFHQPQRRHTQILQGTKYPGTLKKVTAEYRIVMIGGTGGGKSATGNTILNKKIFESKASAGSVTYACKSHRATIQGRQLLLVDTPGIFDTSRDPEEVKTEILKFVAITSPGPHVILTVISVGRFTEEVRKMSEYMQDLLGNNGKPYTITVITGGDGLEEEEQTIEDFITNTPVWFKKFLNETGHRYVVFNNRAKGEEREKQVKNLLRQIKSVIDENDGRHYGSEIYEDAEMALQAKEGKRRTNIMQQNADEIKLLELIDALQKESLAKDKALEEKQNELQELKEKVELLQEDREKRLIEVRDETRKEIENNKLNMSDSWFRGKLHRAGGTIKKLIGLN